MDSTDRWSRSSPRRPVKVAGKFQVSFDIGGGQLSPVLHVGEPNDKPAAGRSNFTITGY
ncbi:MAG: hypothetical protein JO166_00340 [Deltaproteobacteria bacterium]|nr:hypothetical protein [Deltaproteobacteria bacterium]